ncbi:hypothetical protein [Rhodoferax sediminis]|uniref:Uncharacterized protein n=1 Tax=Rhodoferax sediminis TaxID=2509614 RepID=A0A515D694_9BURK|nr:hypothetical protein [Rhodoferax sediminis]QDL35936.1 hypothetical protein EUB48_00495 [Rhodoferax sediminis]
MLSFTALLGVVFVGVATDYLKAEDNYRTLCMESARIGVDRIVTPVLFRYALAAGLNGQPEVARDTLARICRIHEPKRCVEAREGWAALQVRYPQLAGVAAPE